MCLPFLEQTTGKPPDGAHQQHGFLSLTYTKAVTKNVRHKLTSRNERRSFHKLSEGLPDGSPHFLHEILVSAQAFDIVLCFPLLNAVASIFQTKPPRTQKEKRKSSGQPLRTHTLTSRSLPLIYINTSVIRIFVPQTAKTQSSIEGIVFWFHFFPCDWSMEMGGWSALNNFLCEICTRVLLIYGQKSYFTFWLPFSQVLLSI